MNFIIPLRPKSALRPRVITRGRKTWAYQPSSQYISDAKIIIKDQMIKRGYKLIKKEKERNVEITIFLYNPKSNADMDNLEKAILDILSKIVYEDDTQIGSKITKILEDETESPRTEIEVHR